MQTSPRPNRLNVIKLAAATPCDPRTARAYLTGRDVRGDILRHRLEHAARELGIAPIAPNDPQPPASAA